ncbi:odorant receptor 94b-like isoform X2 [Odontomachus brunneus]|uniref:odorant receptor 94b-like isoform X2 n=1 Tax=Odontomachus brunneus TaxID=486640 RepID=UPI0013F2435C|nr:odorant receptor 94b-like isoform X2 [Odontomachus brunneus]
MHILPVSFALLTYTGYWRPAHWPVSSVKYWMYNVYSSFMFTLLQLFVFYGLVDTFLSTSLQEFVDKCFLFLSIFGVSIKLIHLFIRRRRIIGLDEMLLKENCLPRDADEASIRQKFERNARQVTIVCEILNESCAFILTFGQFYPLLKTRTLPVYGWTPFDLSSVAVFLPLLIFQSVGLLLCANSSVAHETLISGLMIEICAQFEILCHRAHMLPTLLMEAEKNSQSKQDLKARERLIIRDLIEHHLFVYNVYKMSNMTSLFTVDFAHIFSYLASMLMQIYLYCWYGNEITLKSVEVCNAVYEMDWTMLKIRVIKDLTIIMMRAAKPFTMSSGYIVTLTTESFMSILKVSYSAYNFLKDS